MMSGMHFFKNISFRITTIYAALFFVGLVAVTTSTMVFVGYYIDQREAIQLVKNAAGDDAFLTALFWMMLLIDSISLVLSFLIGYILSKRALTPIDNIIMQANNFSASNLKDRIIIDGPDDEIKKLANTFNELIERIEHSYEKQNRFALDASHELSTPLAVIKGYVDLIDRWGKDDRAVLDEGILAIKSEVTSMTKLLDTLLVLAKSDNDLFKIEKKKFALDELVVEIVKESKIVAPEHTFELGKNEPVRIFADQRLIKQMIRALIDNAIKYSGSRGKIVIEVERIRENASISISDNGIGIPQKEMPFIFDRFYRVDKARSRSLGGAGLGLSFVKWIVNMHKGSISVRSKPRGITKFNILLPLSKT